MAKQQANGKNGHDGELESYEQELEDFLQRRIKPGLNRGAIPLLARSIAKDIAHREQESSGDDAQHEFEADMQDLQEELGEDWILRFSVHNGNAWLTAEKEDGSQRVEAPTASVILKAARLLDRRGRVA